MAGGGDENIIDIIAIRHIFPWCIMLAEATGWNIWMNFSLMHHVCGGNWMEHLDGSSHRVSETREWFSIHTYDFCWQAAELHVFKVTLSGYYKLFSGLL